MLALTPKSVVGGACLMNLMSALHWPLSWLGCAGGGPPFTGGLMAALAPIHGVRLRWPLCGQPDVDGDGCSVWRSWSELLGSLEAVLVFWRRWRRLAPIEP